MMCITDPSSPVREKLAASEQAPLLVLTATDGTVLAKAQNIDGKLKVEQAEQILQDEIKKGRDNLQAKLDSADKKAEAGDTKGAADEYKEVIKQRCLFPQPAKQAARKLKKLGVPDEAANITTSEFNLAASAQIESAMAAGLKAEMQDRYAEAREKYAIAHRLDPADPTPLRYLGELYRHEIGDWQKARQTFDTILAMQADPLSRAVALHGLGKMTIHEGQFKEGLRLMEQSVETFPLALAYRNLAVYWNSEGDNAKSEVYARQALALAPTDPFNLVFAAVFMAANGHTDEAMKIARANENLMPASYNLAAIYALSGEKDKALALLRRHFFTYERNQSVRSKEMMEARVDRMFLSLRNDEQFLALTSGADGRLPVPDMSTPQAVQR
jgi:tetratricopeptide (TPR) repeat protein